MFRLFREKGTSLTDGLVVTAKEYAFYLRIADDDSLMLYQESVAEYVVRGLFITSHHDHFFTLRGRMRSYSSSWTSPPTLSPSCASGISKAENGRPPCGRFLCAP